MSTLRSGLGLTIAGLLIVVLDFRVNGLDLAFDPVGFVLLAIGVARIATAPAFRSGPSNTRLAGSVILFGIAAFLSVPESLVEPPRPEGFHVNIGLMETLSTLVVVVETTGMLLLLFPIAAHAATCGWTELATQTRVAAYANLAAATIAPLLTLWSLLVGPFVLPLLLVGVAALLLMFAYTVLVLLRARDLPGTLPPPREGTRRGLA